MHWQRSITTINLISLLRAVLWPRWDGLELLSGRAVNTENIVQPLQNDREAFGFTHVLAISEESGLFRSAMLQSQDVIIDREDFIVHAVDQEQLRAYWLVERTVFEQRELVHGLQLELLKIIAIAKLVGQSGGKIERILQIVDVRQPLRMEHVVAAATMSNKALQAIWMRMRESDGIVATSTECPQCFVLLVDLRLLLNPVQKCRPLSIRRSDVLGICWRITSTWNLKNNRRNVLL